MSDKVDPDKPASLRFPNFTATFDSVSMALDHWQTLEEEAKGHAVLVLEDSRVFQPSEMGHSLQQFMANRSGLPTLLDAPP